jgi:hypothetical protein
VQHRLYSGDPAPLHFSGGEAVASRLSRFRVPELLEMAADGL